jgi:exopolysaccharide biosynthesis protein
MTYSELADYMLNKLGCTEALNLDGGSATMWVAGQSRTALPKAANEVGRTGSSSCETRESQLNAINPR